MKPLFFAASLAMASDSLSELDALRLENIALKLELVDAQAKALQAEREALARSICSAAGVELKECVIDPRQKKVTKREQPKQGQ